MWYRIRVDGHQYTVHAPSEREAALRYNELALKHFGPYARLNVVEPWVYES